MAPLSLTELKLAISLGNVLRLLFLAERKIKKSSLPMAAGIICNLLLSRERLWECDFRAFNTLASQVLLIAIPLPCCCHAHHTVAPPPLCADQHY